MLLPYAPGWRASFHCIVANDGNARHCAHIAGCHVLAPILCLSRMLIDMTAPNHKHDEHDSSHDDAFASYEEELAEITEQLNVDPMRLPDLAQEDLKEPWDEGAHANHAAAREQRAQRPRTWSPPENEELDAEGDGASAHEHSDWSVDFSEVDPSLLASPKPRPIAGAMWATSGIFLLLCLAAWARPALFAEAGVGWAGPLGAIGFLVFLVAAVVTSVLKEGARAAEGDNGARL